MMILRTLENYAALAALQRYAGGKMTREQQRAFMRDLAALSAKHGIVITSQDDYWLEEIGASRGYTLTDGGGIFVGDCTLPDASKADAKGKALLAQWENFPFPKGGDRK